jgi:hypothetical protein
MRYVRTCLVVLLAFSLVIPLKSEAANHREAPITALDTLPMCTPSAVTMATRPRW